MTTKSVFRSFNALHYFRAFSCTSEQDTARTFLKRFNVSNIPRETCEVTFSRSSGPGGQNVNKLNTKATLRLRHSKAQWIPEFIRSQLSLHASAYVTKEGDLLMHSQRHRTQEQNKEDCFEKLADIIVHTGKDNLTGETSDETKLKVEKHIRHDNASRIKSKKIHANKKASRRSKGPEH
jgi:peptidyl-tRNA hydrolase ICT1